MPADGTSHDTNWVLDTKIAHLVRRKARELTCSPGFTSSDQHDIEQEFVLHLLRKSALFDPARAKAVTFASRIIENKAASLVRAARTEKRGCANTVSLNRLVGQEMGKPVELAKTIDESAGRRHTGQRQRSEADVAPLKMDVTDANQTLSPVLKDLAALMSHVSQFAAAEVLGISRRQAAAHVETLRKLYAERDLIA